MILQKTSHSVDALREWTAYGVGRVVRVGSPEGSLAENVLALVKSDARDGSDVTVGEADCISVPHGLEAEMAMFAPPLACALWVWEELALELGEVAVYTEGNPLANFIGEVALWRGGCPVIRLGRGNEGIVSSGIERLSVEDPEAALNRLRQRAGGKPGFAAIDLSGDPEMIDVLLEALPQWGRLMLASHRSQPVTLDVYSNIHRKGSSIVSTIFDPSLAFGSSLRDHVRRAFLVLKSKGVPEGILR